jgi:hypothetical protein
MSVILYGRVVRSFLTCDDRVIYCDSNLLACTEHCVV